MTKGLIANSVFYDLDADGEPVELDPPGLSVLDVAISPNGRFALTSRADGSIRLWDTQSADILETWERHDGKVTGLDFAPDGRLAASAGHDDRTLRLWRLPQPVTEEGGWDLPRNSIPATAAELADVDRTLDESPDDAPVLVKSFGLQSRLLHGRHVEFTADGQSVLISAYTRSDSETGQRKLMVQLWDTDTGEFLREYGSEEATSFAISPDDRRVATGGKDGRVRLWELQTGQLVREFAGGESDEPDPDGKAERRVNSVRFSADGARVVSGSHDGLLQVWDVNSGDRLHSLELPDRGAIYAAAFEEDRNRIIGTWGTSLRFWSLDNEQLTFRPYPKDNAVNQLAVSQDGRYVLAAGGTNVRPGHSLFYDLHSEDAPRQLDETEVALRNISLSPNGRFALTTRTDGTVRIWDTRTATVVANLDVPTDRGAYAAFSRDGRRAVTVSYVQPQLSLWTLPELIAREGGWPQTDRRNFALRFNGRDHEVRADSWRYDGSHPLTLEAWVSADDEVVDGTVVSSGGPLKLVREGNWQLSAVIEQDPFHKLYQVSDKRIVPQQLDHVAVVYDGTAVRLYVNGQLQTEYPITISNGQVNLGPLDDAVVELKDVYRSDRLRIGTSADHTPADSFFRSTIDEVRVSDIARYTGNFTPATRFSSDEHTVALYHCDEGVGDTLIDSSGNEHHGTITGASWVPSPIQSRLDQKPLTREEAVRRVLELGGEVWVLRPDKGPSAKLRQVTVPAEIAESEWDHLALRFVGIRELDAEQFVRITDALPEVRSVDLTRTSVGVAFWKVVPQLDSIRQIDIHGIPLVDEDLKTLHALPQLQVVGFNGSNTITDDGIDILASHPNASMFSTVMLHGQPITDNSIALLAEKMPRLRGMTLSETNITDECVESLAKFSEAIGCHLQGTNITDNSVPILSQMESLTLLNIKLTEITSEGFAELQQALPNCRILWEPRPGIPRIQAVQQVLDWGGQIEIVSANGSDVVRQVTNIDQLTVEDWSQMRVDLSTQPLERDDLLPVLSGLPEVRQLILGRFSGQRDVTRVIAHFRNLTDLDLSRTRIGAYDLAPLPRVTTLRALRLNGESVTGQTMPLFRLFKNLTRLEVQESELNEEQLEQLRAAVPDCHIITHR